MTHLREAADLKRVDRLVYARLSLGDMTFCLGHLADAVHNLRGEIDIIRTAVLRKIADDTGPAVPVDLQTIERVLRVVSIYTGRAASALYDASENVSSDIHRLKPDSRAEGRPTEVRSQVIRPVVALTEAFVRDQPTFMDAATCLFEAAEALIIALGRLIDFTDAIYADVSLSRYRGVRTRQKIAVAQASLRVVTLPLRRLSILDIDGSRQATTRAGRRAATAPRRRR